MPTRPTTPDAVDAALVEAEAERNRLADRAAAIREAGDLARHAAEVNEVKRAFAELPKPTRDAAIAARPELDALVAADTFDMDAIVAAFDKRQRLDAECGALATYLTRLDDLDPLPPNHLGVDRHRSPQIGRRHGAATFSAFLDAVIVARQNASYANHLNALGPQLDSTVDAAEQDARSQAAQLADGARLNVDTPTTIVEQYQRAVATVTQEDITAQTLERGNGSEFATARALHNVKLNELLDAEANGAEAAKPSQR